MTRSGATLCSWK